MTIFIVTKSQNYGIEIGMSLLLYTLVRRTKSYESLELVIMNINFYD